MARTKEFEPQEALQKAMLLFWHKGYLDTSMEELVQTTGVSRYGLYSTFGDKQELFAKAITHYANTVINTLLRPLEAADAALPEIQNYFNTLIAMSQNGQDQVGCLIGNTAVELSHPQEEIARQISQHYGRMHSAFGNAVQNGQQQGQISAASSAAAYAEFLIGLANGLLLSMHAQLPQEMLRHMVDVGLTALQK